MSDVTTLSKIIEKTVVNGGDSAKDPKKDTLASGSSLAASGTTRSITKKATIKLGKMTEAAKAALDRLDAVVNAKLPQNAKEYTDDQIKQILDAYKAYNALSVSEKKSHRGDRYPGLHLQRSHRTWAACIITMNRPVSM